MLKKSILIVLIQTLLFSSSVQAQNYAAKYYARSFLSAPLNISAVNFQNSFALISENETQKVSFKKTIKTIFESNKYPATFTFALYYGVIDSINNLIYCPNALSFYASALLSFSSFIALAVYAYDLFSPQSLLKVLPMQQILQQNWIDSSLLKSDQSAAENAAEFLAHVKNNRFEWAITTVQRKNKILNLISQGSSYEIRRSFWSHIVLSSKKIRTSASLHTHPFESWGSPLHFFPSSYDFALLEKKRDFADTYLLVFPKQQFPALLRYQQSPEGKNIITDFIFGEKNVTTILTAILEGENFDNIAAENRQAIITNPAEIIWTGNQSKVSYSDFSYLPTEHTQMMFLLNLRGQKKQKPSTPQAITHNPAPKQSQLNSPQLPSFYPLSPRQQNAVNFSV